ncbi:MAG: YcxB-like protein [Verrucomicrobiota bacterium]|jgi:hypothetical protein
MLPLFGVIFLAYSSKYLLFGKSENSAFGMLLFLLGIFYMILPVLLRKKAVRNMFAGRGGDMAVIVKPSDEGVEMSADGSTTTSPWSSFVDFRICKDGILLYPQKMLQYWIPNSATVEGGTWQDFEALVSSKIQRKI